MSDSKATPAPWSVREVNEGVYYHCVIAPMGYELQTSNNEENLANAKLISAAPELLKALKLITEMRYQIIDGLKRANYPTEYVHEDFDYARAAIDKAEGR